MFFHQNTYIMKKLLIPFFVLSLFFTSCIPSLHPLVTDEIEVKFDDIIGTYETEDEYWQFDYFLGKKGGSIILNIGDHPDSLNGKYLVTFGKINDMLFADFYPTEHFFEFDFGADYIPTHTFARVEKSTDGFVFRYADGDELNKLFTEGKVRLKHEKVSYDDSILITASSKQLQKFMAQHGSNDVFFGIEHPIKRIIGKVEPGE